MIDVLNNKQDKLIAGSGITIANDGKTISASGKEYTAGSGITISDNGVISTTVPIGKYIIPLMASARCSNNSLIIVKSFKHNVSLYPTISTSKIGDTISTSYSGEKNYDMPALLEIDTTTQTSVDIVINLTSIIGSKSSNNCTIKTMFNSSKNHYGILDATIISQPITGSISNGIFTGSFITYRQDNYHYGIGVKYGTSSTTTFTVLIDSI